MEREEVYVDHTRRIGECSNNWVIRYSLQGSWVRGLRFHHGW